VDDAVGVGRFQPGQHFQRQSSHRRGRERALLGEPIGERAAGHVFHDQDPLLRSDLVHAHDVGML